MVRVRKEQLEPKLVPLPCPFCGKLPMVSPENPELQGNAWGGVSCQNRRCMVRPHVTDGCDTADMRGTGAYKDMAIKLWNRRSK